jgi:cardiolipin synthase
MGAALSDSRVLGDTETGPLLAGTGALLVLAAIAILWPAVLGWPIAVLAAWFALNFGIRAWRARRRHQRRIEAEEEPDA